MEVALDLDRLAHIGLDDGEQVLVQLARLGQRHDGNAQAFLEHRAGVGAEADAADVDDVRGRGEQRHQPVALEGRRHHGEVVQMAGAEPGIVGEVDVARPHRRGGIAVEEMADRIPPSN